MTKPAEVAITWTTERDDLRLRRLSELLLSIVLDVDNASTPGEREQMPDSKAKP